jgi:hypothetical protein
MAMAQAAMVAAQEAKTAAEARPKIDEAVESSAEQQGVSLSEEDRKQMVDALVTELESRGAWEAPVETPPPAPSGEGAQPPPPAASETPAPAGGEGEGAGAQPAEGEAPAAEAAPRRPSLAERLSGHGRR